MPRMRAAETGYQEGGRSRGKRPRQTVEKNSLYNRTKKAGIRKRGVRLFTFSTPLQNLHFLW